MFRAAGGEHTNMVGLGAIFFLLVLVHSANIREHSPKYALEAPFDKDNSWVTFGDAMVRCYFWRFSSSCE
jgi:hypothetical protein